MSDYLAQLKMKIQNTPSTATDKTDKSQFVPPSVSSVSVGTKHVLEIDAQPAVAPPRIVKDPHFGSDHVPARYSSAWEALLSQCPVGVNPVIWEAAIYDSADLFGVWGAEFDRLRWTAGDLFDVPHDDKPGGLAWFLRGEHVVALGPERAFTETRVFDRARAHER